jgi:two-component SAPR family response regulator
MVVDDEPATLKILSLIIKQAGYDPVAAESGREALTMIDGGQSPALIISDIAMPGMDGWELFKQIRKRSGFELVPFIFISALDGRADIRQAMSLGADDYITKPFDRVEVISAIEARLRRVVEIRGEPTVEFSAYALGSARVERRADVLVWESQKAMELLFYLLENPGGVTSWQAAEDLWGDKDESKASSSFHTTLHRLRKVVGADAVTSANRRYYLSKKIGFAYDVERFRTLAKRAPEAGTVEAYKAAGDAYGGAYLPEFDSEWVVPVRETLQERQSVLLREGGALAAEQGRHREALALYTRAAQHDPYSDRAWKGRLEMHLALGERPQAQDVLRAYEQFVESELGGEGDPEILGLLRGR